MYSKVKYLLVFVLFVVFCQGYAQQAETTKPPQTSISENLQNTQQKGGELQNKTFVKIDSLSNKSANLLQTTTEPKSFTRTPPSLKSYEGQRQLTNVTDLPTRSLHEGLLLGIGKQLSFSKALKRPDHLHLGFSTHLSKPQPRLTGEAILSLLARPVAAGRHGGVFSWGSLKDYVKISFQN